MPITNKTPGVQYVVDRSTQPPSCYPEGIDRRQWVDLTTIGDMWRKYLDIQTDEIHDGAVYYERAMARGPYTPSK